VSTHWTTVHRPELNCNCIHCRHGQAGQEWSSIPALRAIADRAVNAAADSILPVGLDSTRNGGSAHSSHSRTPGTHSGTASHSPAPAPAPAPVYGSAGIHALHGAAHAGGGGGSGSGHTTSPLHWIRASQAPSVDFGSVPVGSVSHGVSGYGPVGLQAYSTSTLTTPPQPLSGLPIFPRVVPQTLPAILPSVHDSGDSDGNYDRITEACSRRAVGSASALLPSTHPPGNGGEGDYDGGVGDCSEQ
jgi:hypothetical protein